MQDRPIVLKYNATPLIDADWRLSKDPAIVEQLRKIEELTDIAKRDRCLLTDVELTTLAGQAPSMQKALNFLFLWNIVQSFYSPTQKMASTPRRSGRIIGN
jgi:hypothetical protein